MFCGFTMLGQALGTLGTLRCWVCTCGHSAPLEDRSTRGQVPLTGPWGQAQASESLSFSVRGSGV